MPTLLEPQPTDPTARLYAKIAALEARIEAMERYGVLLPIVAGSPSGGRSGNAVGDSSNTRLWLNINGSWRYTALT
jgi:hypothetical protein